MSDDIPLPPEMIPDDKSSDGLDKWSDSWVAYRNELVDHLSDLFATYDNARELAPRLVAVCQAVDDGDDPKRWKLTIVAKGPNRLTLRRNKTGLNRDEMIRSPEGHWFIDDDHPGYIYDSTVGREEMPPSKLAARRFVETVFYWGDLNAIFNAKSYLGPAGWVPPIEQE